MKIGPNVRIKPEAIQKELDCWVANFQDLERRFSEYRVSNGAEIKKLRIDLKTLERENNNLRDDLKKLQA